MSRHGWLLPVALAAAGGCMNLTKPAKPGAQTVEASPVTVKLQGGKLFATDEATLPPTELLNRVRAAVATGQPQRVELGAARHPDAALEALRSASGPAASDPTVRALAAAYDRVCVRDPQARWEPYLADRAANPKKYADFDAKRAQVIEHTRTGRYAEAAAVKLASSTPKGATLAALDAAHLTAAAALAADQPKVAVATITAVRPSLGNYPHQGAYLLLLLSEAERRSGRDAEAAACWSEATDLAAGLLAASVVDPVLWDRCAYLRPTDRVWSKPNRDALARAAGQSTPTDGAVRPAGGAAGPTDGSESLVWACVGHARLKRGEPQLALAAFKQAEAWSPEPGAQAAHQFAQAQALVEIGQPAAAAAILTKLAATTGPHTAPSRALLGSVLLQSKSVQQALPVLRKAVEEGGEYPARAQTEANLGLALLITGSHEEGLRWVRSAQKRFEVSGEWDQLRQSLENEAGYLEKVGKKTEAKAVRQRLTTR